jgi:hypothetical protein
MNKDIKQKLQQAMGDLWWAPPSLQVINHPEICYCIDPKNRFNVVVRINTYSSNLKSLVQEFSQAHKLYESKIVTYQEQSPDFFTLLTEQGYQEEDVHDIRYLPLSDLQHHDNPNITTKIVKTKEDLILLEKTQAKAFGVPYQQRDSSELEYHLQEYNKSNPRTIRVLALDKKTGEPLGCGGMSLFPDLGVSFFFAGGTIPKARNQGVYSALIGARTQYAKPRGISFAGIFARQQSSAPIVARQGFIKCGEMTYWKRDPS